MTLPHDKNKYACIVEAHECTVQFGASIYYNAPSVKIPDVKAAVHKDCVKDDAEAQCFWTIHHLELRVHLFMPKEESPKSTEAN